VCGAPVQWSSRLNLGDESVPVYLCRDHQQTLGLDYPPEPPLS